MIFFKEGYTCVAVRAAGNTTRWCTCTVLKSKDEKACSKSKAGIQYMRQGRNHQEVCAGV